MVVRNPTPSSWSVRRARSRPSRTRLTPTLTSSTWTESIRSTVESLTPVGPRTVCPPRSTRTLKDPDWTTTSSWSTTASWPTTRTSRSSWRTRASSSNPRLTLRFVLFKIQIFFRNPEWNFVYSRWLPSSWSICTRLSRATISGNWSRKRSNNWKEPLLVASSLAIFRENAWPPAEAAPFWSASKPRATLCLTVSQSSSGTRNRYNPDMALFCVIFWQFCAAEIL